MAERLVHESGHNHRVSDPKY